MIKPIFKLFISPGRYYDTRLCEKCGIVRASCICPPRPPTVEELAIAEWNEQCRRLGYK